MSRLDIQMPDAVLVLAPGNVKFSELFAALEKHQCSSGYDIRKHEVDGVSAALLPEHDGVLCWVILSSTSAIYPGEDGKLVSQRIMEQVPGVVVFQKDDAWPLRDYFFEGKPLEPATQRKIARRQLVTV